MIVHQANIQKGEWILIHGIGGGVGIAAMQIAKNLGAKIIGTASSAKFDRIKKMEILNLLTIEMRILTNVFFQLLMDMGQM